MKLLIVTAITCSLLLSSEISTRYSPKRSMFLKNYVL
jgi:hypothetical protein